MTLSIKSIILKIYLVTVYVVGLYPSILHESGLSTIKEALDNRKRKSIPVEDILKILEFVSKNNYFEFKGKVKKQLSGTAIRTKYAPPYTCIFMDKTETGK